MIEDDKVLEIRKQLIGQHQRVGENYVFIRIPKTGSASMERALYAMSIRQQGNDLSDEQINCLKPHPGWGWDHYSARFCRDTLGKNKWENSFTFALVRNPFDRLYSYWKYCHCVGVVNGDPDMQIYVDTSFEKWMLEGCHCVWNRPHHKVVFPKSSLLSQREWIADEAGIIVDWVCRLEELESKGLPYLSAQCGINFIMPKNRINATSHPGEYREHYNSTMIDYVNEHCHKDIEAFGYNFEGIK